LKVSGGRAQGLLFLKKKQQKNFCSLWVLGTAVDMCAVGDVARGAGVSRRGLSGTVHSKSFFAAFFSKKEALACLLNA
jgi:hypothetical protein